MGGSHFKCPNCLKVDRMERKTTSLKINPNLWKKVKIHCINHDLDIAEYIEELIKKDLQSK